MSSGAAFRPSLGEPRVAAALFFAFFVVALTLVGSQLLGDPDSWWHVAVGREILAAGSFPRTDTLSHTFAGEPWIAKEWLSQVLLAIAHDLGGWPTVALLAAVMIAGTFSLLFGWLMGRVRWSVALTLTVIAAAVASPHFLARPHIFSWPLLIVWLAVLLGTVENRRVPPWWLLGVLVLWSNLHASTPLAFAIAGTLGLEAVARAERGERARTFVRWLAFGAAAVVAAMISPYGAEPLIVAVDLFGAAESLNFITEWQPTKLDVLGIFAIVLLVGTLASLARRPGLNAFRIALTLALAYMAARHERFLSIFAIVSLMLAARSVGGLLPATARPESGPASWIAAAVPTTVAAAASAILVAATSPSPAARTSPVDALAAARAAGVGGPVFNAYSFGGYLIFAGVPTFIDGRSDQLFLDGFFTAYDSAMNSDNPAELIALLDSHAVGWALVEPDSIAADHLDTAGNWRSIYVDAAAAVYVRAH